MPYSKRHSYIPRFHSASTYHYRCKTFAIFLHDTDLRKKRKFILRKGKKKSRQLYLPFLENQGSQQTIFLHFKGVCIRK